MVAGIVTCVNPDCLQQLTDDTVVLLKDIEHAHTNFGIASILDDLQMF